MLRAGFLVLMLLVITGPVEAGCVEESFEGNDYAVCRFDLREDHLQVFNAGPDGAPYGSFQALDQALREQGKSLIFGMNAGMFNDQLKPIGLYVEAGQRLKKLNRRNGPGNFHMKPNGVFFIAGKTGGVMETEAYAKAGLKADHASQSGPMLVIDGEIHLKLSQDSTSRKRRNGVGAIDDHMLVFVISESAVNFHAFARLFRNRLYCRNALFLDGSISSLFAPELSRRDSFFRLGPIVGLAK